MAQTLDGGKLKEAAERRQDETILVHIRGKDCVAVEAQYHRKGYFEYVDFLLKKPADPGGKKFQRSFELFCRNFIEKRLIKDKQILMLSFLVRQFIKLVNDTEGIVTTYQGCRLKARIKQRYPQIVFHPSKTMTKGTLVYSDNLTAGELADNDSSIGYQSSDEDADSDNDDQPMSFGRNYSNSISTLFGVALELRNELRECKGVTTSCWPPDSQDLTLASALESIPSKIFNFISWLVGYSEEPVQNEKVNLELKDACKVASICQDLIYASGRGKVATHKSLALGMAVRQITGSVGLLRILHGLGHCASADTVYKHDSALTVSIINGENDSFLPRNIVNDVFTCLVWDNNDFREETPSGKGTTHVTNGIAIQRNHGTQDLRQKAAVSKKIRTVAAPPVDILPYFSKCKGEPALQSTNPDITFNSPVDQQEQIVGRKLDFIHVLCKKVSDGKSEFSQEMKGVLPSWTGFNTQLFMENTKELSNIGYLPVIDAPVTELSTVFTLLNKSMAIANKLCLPEIVLVMDEAVYAKAQVIRWRNEEIMNKVVIRLGAFHTVMSYCSGISKIFKDAGLQVSVILNTLFGWGT